MRLHAFNAKKEYQKLMFKQYKNKYIKYGTIILSVCILIFAIMYFSFSKFSTTKKFNVINAKVGDFSSGHYAIAAYIDGTKSATIPIKTDGYGIEKIECTNSANGTWDYNDWGIKITNATSTGTKCNVYFVQNLSGKIITSAGGKSIIEAKTTPTFTTNATTDEGMFATPDDYGTSYYYRGAVTTNNVIFGGFCWKVIRINGDGTTRMIYNGSPTNGTCVATGTSTQIGTGAFNSTPGDNAYVGYMYGSTSSSSYAATHSNNSSSAAKSTVESWYSANLTSYASKISDTEFCNDRSLSSGTGTSTTATNYGSYGRLKLAKNPILTCPQKSDRFTVSDSNVGNAKLTYPIGLITADEVAVAGGVYSTTNSNYYLYSNQNNWTMTPDFFGYDGNWPYACEFILESSGAFGEGGAVSHSEFGIRPVINLNVNALYSSGDGTSTSPYLIS